MTEVYLVVSQENPHVGAVYPVAVYTSRDMAEMVASAMGEMSWDEHWVVTMELDPEEHPEVESPLPNLDDEE